MFVKLDMDYFNQFFEPRFAKMAPMTMFEGTYCGSSTIYFKEKPSIYHVFVLGTGQFFMLPGAIALDDKLKKLEPLARGKDGVPVIVAYAGKGTKVGKDGKSYQVHRYSVRTKGEWFQRQGYEPETEKTDDIPF